MSAYFSFNGRITFQGSGAPTPGLRLELVDANNGYGWLGGGQTDASGYFQLRLSEAVGVLISNHTISVQIKLYKGGVLVHQQVLADVGSNNDIQIPVSEYDSALPDVSHLSNDQTNYILIRGNVTNAAGLPLQADVSVKETGFRASTLVGSSVTNSSGYYELKIASRELYHSDALGRHIITIEASTLGGVTVSANRTIDGLEVICNLEFEEPGGESVNEYDFAVSAIQGIIGSASIASIMLSEPDSEASYISNATGLSASTVKQVVNAHQYAAGTAIHPKFFYALIRVKQGFSKNGLVGFPKEQLTASIGVAIDESIIAASESEVNSAADSLLELQIALIKDDTLPLEELDFDSAFSTVFNDSVLVDKYLRHSVDYNDSDREHFWTTFQSANGEANTKKLKKGFQLLAVTGFQPELSAFLLSDPEIGLGIEDNCHLLAAKTTDEWIAIINEVCTSSDKLIVPKSFVKDPGDPEASILEYAAKLKEVTQRLYPFVAINKKLHGTEGADLIADSDTRNTVKTFLSNNPKLDLRFSSVHDINEESYNLTGVTNLDQLKEALAPFQRISRVTGGKPDAITSLISTGFSSAKEIAASSEESFVTTYAEAFGDESTARKAYSTAQDIYGAASMALLDLSGTNDNPLSNSPVMPDGIFADPNSDPATPDLSTLFGPQEKCSCEYCMSVYSPAAYYTDIMHFLMDLDKSISSGASRAYNELTRRRPDLPFIDLTCKNSNTPVPYVDLVNELLEIIVLKELASATPPLTTAIPPLSFQTSGKAAELSARPEHMVRVTPPGGSNYYVEYTAYSEVYDKALSAAKYPDNLPFNLGLEESRVYLRHLGISRLDLMRLYKPFVSSALLGTDNTTYNRCSEYLRISKAAADIITDTSGALTWIYYGFGPIANPTTGYVTSYSTPYDPSVLISGDWYKILMGKIAGGGVDVIIQQLRITYKELLQLITTRFLNPINSTTGNRDIAIAAKSIPGYPIDPNTCVLVDLELFTTLNSAQVQAFLGRVHRFVRLWRASGMSIYAVDKMLCSLGAADIDTGVYMDFVRVMMLADEMGTTPDYISGWLNQIDTEQYIDFDSERQDPLPSFYDHLFRNRNVLNPPDPAFSNFVGSIPTFTVDYQNHTAAISAGLGVTEPELLLLLAARGVSVTSTISLAELGVLLGIRTFARGLRWTIKEFLLFMEIAGISIAGYPASGAGILDSLQEIVDRAKAVKASRFTIKEIAYLLQNLDPDKAFVPTAETIQIFYQTLRKELKKVETTSNAANQLDALKNAVIQQFASEFNIEAEIIRYLTDTLIRVNLTVPAGTPPAADTSMASALTDANFIAGGYDLSFDNATNTSTLSPLPNWDLAELYNTYYRIAKIALMAARLRIKRSELEVLEQHHSPSELDILGLNQLPIDNSSTALVYSPALVRYERWFTLRDRLRMDESEFVQMTGGLFAPTPLTHSAWKSLVESFSGWDSADLTELVGAASIPGSPGTAIGELHVRFPQDFAYPEVIGQIADIMDAHKRIGLTPNQLTVVLHSDLVLEDAHKIMKAARARHSEESWLKVAKPLHDVLREKQRQALVAYLLANPLPGERWRNENELFAYLLIDVEMKPCMMTSRIKQAIGTVQLFFDRLVMNLEVFLSAPITRDQIKQWKTWRKWYRIWEANRKVFIYPENWIEPELRDNKTPFFRELETQLLQDEVKADKVENAYYEYLEKLDEVARLEPMACYRQYEEELGIDIVHVVARTYAQPHHYYYRKLENEEWTAWERMNLEIKGDHLSLVVWNRRLHVFWLTFIEKTANTNEVDKIKNDLKWGIPGAGPQDYWVNQVQMLLQNSRALGSSVSRGDTSDLEDADGPGDRFKYHQVLLNWSELKEDKWLAPRVSKDPMELKTHKVQVNFRNLYVYSFYNIGGAGAWGRGDMIKFFELLSKNRELQLQEVFKNRLYLLPAFDSNGALILSLCFGGGSLDEYHTSIHAFISDDSSADLTVFRNDYRIYSFLSPNNTVLNRMKFQQMEQIFPQSSSWRNSGTLDTLGYRWEYNWGGYFIYNWGGRDNAPGDYMPMHISDAPILRATPYPPYVVTARSNMNIGTPEINPMEDDFFYEDKYYNYFVRKVAVAMDFEMDGSGGVFDNMTYEDAVAVYEEAYRPADYTIMDDPGSDNTDGQVPVHLSTMVRYYFQTFCHPHIHPFIKTLNKDGIEGLLQIGMQDIGDSLDFANDYQPSWLVSNTARYPYPTNVVEFKFDGAYSQYNWELFFHIPMLVAGSLSTNQQFDEAQKWYHYIFNPTSNTDDTGSYTGHKKRFWKFRPFYEMASGGPSAASFFTAYAQQIRVWQANPFQPHVIARMRIIAYMKNVVMKYIDNLLSWGDQLFRRNTIESINEATQLYILAANILGPRPQSIPPRSSHDFDNFDDLVATGTLDDFSNALVKIETFFAPNAFPGTTSTKPVPGAVVPTTQYFCIAANDRLLKYWDLVADRLFKIRNCMNIEGQVQQLPLFEPPIDPAMLVRAAAAGIDLNTVLDEATGISRPLYRFNFILQKASELVADVKALGGAISAALEKKDAEKLALLRSQQEIELLDKVTFVKESQLNEAKSALEALLKTKENTTLRLNYYNSRVFMNANEQRHLQSVHEGLELQKIQSYNESIASSLAILPQFHAQVSSSVGSSFGGQQLSAAQHAVGALMGIMSAINSTKGSMAATTGGYERRRDDWNFQAETAKKELEQLDKQILGAELRISIAERELANHLKQVDNSREVDAYMRGKFTNLELYNWTVSQLAATYFQTYQLAYDMAKKAEQCYDFELPHSLSRKPASGFVSFGYWDSLRKGLLSGEKLQFDLRKMEHTFLDENRRYLELTKHISIASLDPAALADLIVGNSSGLHKCTISLPEWLFDLDYPGHYMRRIKSVSISIPCVAGPYTTVSCKLSLNNAKFRYDPTGSYPESPVGSDGRFVPQIFVGQAIATSHGQNDSGLFELSFRDERYLPFEGAGVISEWDLELPAPYPQFDYASISDVILHINYTALEDGGLHAAASEYVRDLLADEATSGAGFLRGISVHREYSSEWYAYSSTFNTDRRALAIELSEASFPYYAKGKSIAVSKLDVRLPLRSGIDPAAGTYTLDVVYLNAGVVTTKQITLTAVATVLTGSTSSSSPAFGIEVAGNTRILKFMLSKTVPGNVTQLNMGDVLQDLQLVLHCTCDGPAGGYPAASDLEWDDSKPPVIASMQGWWRSDKGITLVSGGVASWADQSGKGRTVSAPTVSSRPGYSSSIVEFASGRNGVVYLQSGLNLGTKYTISIVCRVDAFNKEILGSSGVFGGGANYGLYFASNRVYHYPGSTTQYFEIPISLTLNSTISLLMVRNDQTLELYCNGVYIGSSTIALNPDFIIDNLCGENSLYYFVGGLHDVILYDRLLNAAERALLSNYLKIKYNV